MNNEQIAGELGIATQTVRNYISDGVRQAGRKNQSRNYRLGQGTRHRLGEQARVWLKP
jgi:DNA-binding NarL/FixJ family response regulator